MMAKHHLYLIGYTDLRRADLDVTLEEAQERYRKSVGDYDADHAHTPLLLEFDEEFGCASVWRVEGKQ